MSDQVFNARIDLLASTGTEDPSIFIVEFNVFDGTGQFGAASILVGDSVYIDTYVINSTISHYKVHEVLGTAGNYFNGKIKYHDTGDVADPGALSLGPGAANGFICRISNAHQLSWFSAPTIHTFYDYITQYARDHEAWELLDSFSVTGPQGIQGYTGALGATGLVGAAGTTGIAGVAGVTGLAGTAGETGLAGSAGTQGATGLAGSAGTQGATGLAGSAGTQGATGLAGSAGIQGATGLAGSAGIQGATGLAGSAGTQGATGLAGSAGTQGATGLAGSAGTQGATGLAGSAGIQGATGLAGSAGTQGATGLAGSAGTQGATGLAGSAGTQGSTGVAGSAGIQGTTGLLGAQGDTGYGVQGETGASGASGAVIQDITFLSGLAYIRAYGTTADLATMTVTKDFSVSATSRLLVTAPSSVELIAIGVTFTAAETTGRTTVNIEYPEQTGASTLAQAKLPVAIRHTAAYGVNSTGYATGPQPGFSGTLVISFGGYAAAAEQKMTLLV